MWFAGRADEGEQALYGRLLKTIATSAAGEPAWREPAVLAAGLPIRQATGRPYRGINVLLLWYAAPTVGARTWAPGGDASTGVVVVGRPGSRGSPAVRIARFVRPADPIHPPPVWVPPELVEERLERVLGRRLGKGTSEERCAAGALALAKASLQDGAVAGPRMAPLRDELGTNAGPLLAELSAAFLLAHFRVRAHVQAVRGPLARLRAAGPPPGHRLLPTAASIAQRLADRMLAHLVRVEETAEDVEDLDLEEILSRPATTPRAAPAVEAEPSRLAEVTAALRTRDDPESAAVLRWVVREPLAALRALKSPGDAPLDAVWRASGVPRIGRTLEALATSLGCSNATWRAVGAALGQRVLALPELPAGTEEARHSWRRLRTRHVASTWFHHRSALTFADLEWWVGAGTHWSNHRLEWLHKDIGDVPSLAHVPVERLGDCLGMQRVTLEDEDESLAPFAPPRRSLFHGPDWPSFASSLLAGDPYRTETRRKRDGSTRTLHVPTAALAEVQRWIGNLLVDHWPLPGTCAGLAPHRSAAYHARIHAGARQAVVVDIRDFFGSVRPHQVFEWLDPEASRPLRSVHRGPFARWSPEGREAILRLLFRWPEDAPPHLPQGAPSSPVAANLAASRMDTRIQRVAARVFPAGEWRFSRYADDLVLSTTSADEDFPRRALQILRWGVRSMGWRIHPRKTRWWRTGQGIPLIVCGVRVPEQPDDPLGLSREHKRRLRNILHRWKPGAEALSAADRGLVAYAYQVTGDVRLLGLSGGKVRGLALSLAGRNGYGELLEGWVRGT